MPQIIANKLLIVACLAVIVCTAYSASVRASAESFNSAQYSDLPPPPPKPEKFTSKQQLKEYLIKLHEYYAIIGRPRFGRSYPSAAPNGNNNILSSLMESRGEADSGEIESSTEILSNAVPDSLILELMDENHDGFTSKDEMYNFIKLFHQL